MQLIRRFGLRDLAASCWCFSIALLIEHSGNESKTTSSLVLQLLDLSTSTLRIGGTMAHMFGGGPVLAKAPAHVAELCYEHEGVIMSFFMTPKCIDQTRHFKIRPDDVFIITYPKTGTTWAQLIMLLVKFNGDLGELDGKHIMMAVPFLETVNMVKASKSADINALETFCEVADAMPTDSPRILKSHIDPCWLPEGLRAEDGGPEAKVVYVARNPKDTAVSFYHFCQYITELPNYTWDEFFEEFMAGRIPGGSWFDHTLYWWKLRNHDNVLFLTYEEMKQDVRKAVVRIAEFMGKSLTDEVIDTIVKKSTFKEMKSNDNTNPDIAYKDEVDLSGNKSFYRKGVVGDWKNYFTDEQSRRLDKLYEERSAGSGLTLVFE